MHQSQTASMSNRHCFNMSRNSKNLATLSWKTDKCMCHRHFCFYFAFGAVIGLQLQSFPMRSYQCCNTVDISNSQVTVRQADRAAVTRLCGAGSHVPWQCLVSLTAVCQKLVKNDCIVTSGLKSLWSEFAARHQGRKTQREPMATVWSVHLNWLLTGAWRKDVQPLRPPANRSVHSGISSSVLCHTVQKKGV